MRKILFSLAGLLTFGGMMAQPVADNAVIPVSVTLHSILRLNVTSGGNIEFIVNTLDQYTNGIPNSTRYTTTFTVASSLDFDVEMYAEDGTFIGSDDATTANTMALNNLGYAVESTGGGTVGATDNYQICGAVANPSTVRAITNGAFEIVSSVPAPGGAGGAGDINQNRFEVQWELGTGNGTMTTTPLLTQNLASDRYSTNIFLVLKAHD